ncbi:related to secretory protein SSP120 [Cephalotrichum gorgonifer]|uniref:Related to secretory protein SSP120 n=1 Tax=Cephalotrichum gorgonifer TaxID=2041049 RepID=A0AAE8MTE2_9PEZI|nr:related to secretory protein SSP120 [Cephalotrichum gorgonifer]
MRFLMPAVLLATTAHAHGSHSGSEKPVVPDDANWMTKHMAEEHHLDHWDPASFFTLHDFNSDGVWQPEEILRTYGVFDESNKDLPPARRDEILAELMALLDPDQDGKVTQKEFVAVMAEGKTLPDVGTGPGHHGDDEYEYEIHHWEKYHDDDTQLEDLTHPEDIEHFKKHEEMERQQELLDNVGKRTMFEENIPAMFLRELR